MVFTKEQSEKMKILVNNIPNEVDRIMKHHEDLQDITKEFLGESMSEEVIKKIIKQDLEKEIFNKMVGVLFGE